MKREGIRWKLLQIVLIPIVLLGISIVFFGVMLIYSHGKNSIRDEVEAITYMLKGCLDLSVRGDYQYDNGMLKKGEINISDSTLLYEIKENSQIDTTIFWGDTRIITTIENEYGVSAVGTKAEDAVIKNVLEEGKNYFSDELGINGVKYIGHYTPLKNGDGTIVGMVFAGKPATVVSKQIYRMLFLFVLLSVMAVMGAMIMSRQFTRHLLKDINSIKQYLYEISEGNFAARRDAPLMNRQDEIGEIGVYADKMCSALKTMVELDALTSLYNRRTCNNRLKALEEGGEAFCVVMCDVDWFKRINDQYGHECGDYVLVCIADMLRMSVEDCGFASRWGGEEFLLIYQLEEKQVVHRVQKLLEQIRETEFQYQGNSFCVTMTFGVKASEQGVAYENIIKCADDNLYIGKNAGRNRIVS